jgi:hypothetical protein
MLGGNDMNPMLQCTVCNWRGSFEEANEAPPAPKASLPAHLMAIQEAYDDVQRARAERGEPPPPPCPWCGYHTKATRRPARQAS